MAKFTGKHLRLFLILIKLQAFRPATILKRRFNIGTFLWILPNFSEKLIGRTAAPKNPTSHVLITLRPTKIMLLWKKIEVYH